MRLLLGVAVFGLFFIAVSASIAQMDLTGSWLFTWQNDSKNTNPAMLKYEAGTFTGTYINDAKEKCPVVGRFDSSGTKVILTITCPKWEIRCDGTIKSPALIEGHYLAYGSTTGVFKMTRQ